MCFGSSDKEEHWWGYIDDNQGWTARPKSEYMATPAYNKELRRNEKETRKALARKGIRVPKQSKYTKRW